MASEAKLLDLIALTEDLPELGLRRGQVGTVVDTWGDGSHEVEFVGNDGVTYAMASLREDQVLVLLHEMSGKG